MSFCFLSFVVVVVVFVLVDFVLLLIAAFRDVSKVFSVFEA